MFKHLLWMFAFFVLIGPYCCCFECFFYINKPLPPTFLGIYSLSISALGCNILCTFNNLHVFGSIFFNSEIFQSMMLKLYCTAGTARLLIAFGFLVSKETEVLRR